MTRLVVGLALISALCAPPLAAQSNAELMANDHYSRSHDYDLLHQQIEVRDFDWDSTSLNGRVTTTLRALRQGFDSVVLDAGAGLDIRGVTLAPAGAALPHRHQGDTLVVRLPRPAGFGDTVRFTIDYHARIDNGRGLTFIAADSLPPARPQQLWSQGEDDNNHYWFPTYDFPNDKATWDLIATVPRRFTVVSNGRLVADRPNRDGSHTVHWRLGRPSATYLASIIISPLVKLADRWRGIPVDYYVYRADSARARRLFAVTPDMIEVYSRLTGVKYPWVKYAQTTVADFFGGMENVSATTLVDWIPDAAAYRDRPWYRHILIPHELAHQWFGDYVTTANWANMWLNEGFAEFMPGQYWSVRLGRHAEEDYYLDEYRQYLNIDRRRRLPLASLGSNAIYPKGALVLEMLRKYLGERRFWAGVNRYLEDHALGVATTDDLRQAMLAATGENLDWFWNQWIYQAGFPEFEVQASWDSAASSVLLTVKQTQQDTLKPDSTGLRVVTPEVFRMPVTVRVGTAAGDVTLKTWLTERSQEIRVSGVPAPPTKVVFDDGNTILKTLRFDQPTPWLARQLAEGPDLWNRWWVIQQLAARKDDPQAAAALARAATGADYFLTREHATEALGAFAGDPARAALLQAARDTSAQVRAAAVATLAGFQGDEVVGAVRTAWEGDSSYSVRAAALESLARLVPAEAHDLIRSGLRTPSYQDAIADAALSSIAAAGDTTLLDEVNQEVDRYANAAFVLGALGRRGSGRALDLLGGHLTSPRQTVRHRVLQAFQFIVPPDTARARLTALLQAAPDAKLRAEIEQTLGRLRQ
jgi:aminopeptidase N